MNKKKEGYEDDDLDDELEKQWELQDQIHRKCKMKEKSKGFNLD
ncbi:MAG: hypothetical protein ACXADU_05770 [Promethearchaeota archaeon]|jgi:hypothetical protein